MSKNPKTCFRLDQASCRWRTIPCLMSVLGLIICSAYSHLVWQHVWHVCLLNIAAILFFCLIHFWIVVKTNKLINCEACFQLKRTRHKYKSIFCGSQVYASKLTYFIHIPLIISQCYITTPSTRVRPSCVSLPSVRLADEHKVCWINSHFYDKFVHNIIYNARSFVYTRRTDVFLLLRWAVMMSWPHTMPNYTHTHTHTTKDTYTYKSLTLIIRKCKDLSS